MEARRTASACLAVLLVAAALAGAEASRPRPVDIEASFSEGEGGQHPDAHVDGFTLRAVYAHHFTTDGSRHHLHKRTLKFDKHPHLTSIEGLKASRKLLAFPEFSPGTNSKDKILALAKLNLLAYPGAKNPKFPDYYYDQATLDPIYKNKDGIFGTSNTRDGEIQAMQDLWDAVKAEVDSSTGTWNYKFTPDGASGAETKIGVAALEFVRGNLKVLVFRGSVTPGDFSNIQNWLFDWILEGMDGQMKKMWTQDAGLVWGQDQMDREQQSSKKARTAIIGDSWFMPKSFDDDLAAAAKNIPGVSMSVEQAADYGYWPIARKIADDLWTKTPSTNQVILSGHSQGGTRAGLVSMYIEKKYNVVYETKTFSATGAQCFPRLLGSNKNLLTDVDPYISHPQVTDYSHVLDLWGNGLGLEIGNQCLYGRTGILDSKAYKYCSKIWGTPGPNLIFANSAPSTIKMAAETQLDIDFADCRLMTHLIETVVQDLSKNGVLLDNGDTADGCKIVPVATKDDPDKVCPSGSFIKSFSAATRPRAPTWPLTALATTVGVLLASATVW